MHRTHLEHFPQSNSKSSQPLQKAHIDDCGPLPLPSPGVARYFATYLDDDSKLSIMQPVASKARVAAHTLGVLQYLETQSGYKVRTVRTDGGDEYVKTALEAYLSEQGIAHLQTVSYTPQQIGNIRAGQTPSPQVRAGHA